MNKVSIIVPVYNAENVIHKCLDNLINQTYENIEIICVNDGSKDRSIDLLHKYSINDKRIIVFSNENHGPAYTRNFAISRATGAYLMFCDADDWYEPTMVEDMVKALEQNNVDIAMCDTNIVDRADGNLQNAGQNSYHKLSLQGFHKINIVNIENINTVLWNKIFKMDLIQKYCIKYPIKYEHDDSMFFLKYMTVAKTYFGVNKILYNYVVGNTNSIMGNVYTKKNTGRQFDFLYSFIDLFEYCEKYASSEYIEFLKQRFLAQWQYFKEYLDKNDLNQAFNILKNIVEKNAIFEQDDSFEITRIKMSENYIDYSNNAFLYKTNFIQKIFSIKNENKTHKVVRLLGLKFKFKRRTKQLNKENIIQYRDENAIKPAFQDNNVVLVFNCDSNFIKYLSVAIASIVKNSSQNNNYDIIILHTEIPYAKQFALNRIIEKYPNFKIRYVDVKTIIDEYGINDWFTGRLNATAYYRCVAPIVLKNYDRFLYLDSDIISNIDIAETFNTDLEDKTVGAVKDDYVSQIISDEDVVFPNFISYAHKMLGINDTSKYFNTGVLLVDNIKIINSYYLYHFVNVGKRNNLYFHDQNIFNSLYIGDVKYLDSTYNAQLSNYYPDEEIQNKKILHYCSKLKPWSNVANKYSDYIWWDYAKYSPFYQEILKVYMENIKEMEQVNA